MKNKAIILFIFVTGLFLRMYRLDSYPTLLWDEAALGYNSYSILRSGRDEFGQFLPLVFKSFGDYKPGLYVYLSLPFIRAFGLSVFSIRLLSALAGISICYLLYLVTKHFQPKLAVLVMVIATFSPWAIHFSRGAWESNLATFFLLLSIYLFFQKKYLLTSFFLGLNLYAYQSTKFYCLAFLFFFLVYNFKSKLTSLKLITPFFLLSLPLLWGIFLKNDSNRLKVLSILSYPQSISESTQILNSTGPTLQNIFFNQPTYFVREIFRRYLNHFSPQFLFWQGDWANPRHSAPYTGLMLWPLLLLLPLGLFYPKISKSRDLFFLMIFWLLIAPLPAALTRDEIQANRTLGMFVPLSYFSALGYGIIKNKIFKAFIFITFVLGLVYYLDMYYNHMVKKSPDAWLSGYAEATQFALAKPYEHIYFTDFYGQPYIYFLFYKHYDPFKYQEKNHFVSPQNQDVGTVTQLDNISFGSFSFNSLKATSNSLIVLSRDELLRQNLDFKEFKAIAPVGDSSNFYTYVTKP